jgi:hypothetical protein
MHLFVAPTEGKRHFNKGAECAHKTASYYDFAGPVDSRFQLRKADGK